MHGANTSTSGATGGGSPTSMAMGAAVAGMTSGEDEILCC
jgi:hypothetical protein